MTNGAPSPPLPTGQFAEAEGRQQIRGGVTTLEGSRGEVATPPRKSLPLRVSDLSALPQGEGWPEYVAPLSILDSRLSNLRVGTRSGELMGVRLEAMAPVNATRAPLLPPVTPAHARPPRRAPRRRPPASRV